MKGSRNLGIIVVLLAFLGLGSAQQAQQSQRAQPDPCQEKTRVIGDVTYCDRYWECINGRAELFDCPNGLVFVGRNRGIADGCDYPWRSSNSCRDKSIANGAISAQHCEWLYGIFGHETSCTRYWTCWNGTATEQFCIGGLLYNEDTHACDWPEAVTGCQKHPLCKDDANANVPLGKSCERYWACQGGYPRLQRCPATLVFDRQSKRCVNPPTLDCDIPPPPIVDLVEEGVDIRTRNQPQPRPQGGGGGQPVQIRGGQQTRRQQAQQTARRPQLSQRAQQQQQAQRPQPQFQNQQQQFQEQELPPSEQFVEEIPAGPQGQQAPLEDVAAPPPPPQSRPRPVRPQRPFSSQSDGPQLPFVPQGAIPIQFNSGGGAGPRLPPIPGAIPIRLN